MDWLAFEFCFLLWILHASECRSKGFISTESVNVPVLRKSPCETPPMVDACLECTCDDGVQTCRNICDAIGYQKKERECLIGEQIPEPDECNTCICFEGTIHCTQKQCDEEDYFEGQECTLTQYVYKSDGCNECHCSPEGRFKCTNLICIPEYQCSKDSEETHRVDSCNICACLNDHMRCTAHKCPTAIIEATLPPANNRILEVQPLLRFKEDYETNVRSPAECTSCCNECLICVLTGCMESILENNDGLIKGNTQNQLQIYDYKISNIINPLLDIITQKCNRTPSKVAHTPAYNTYQQEVKVHSTRLPKDTSKLLKILATSLNRPTLANISNRLSSSSKDYPQTPTDQRNVQSNYLPDPATESSINNLNKLITTSTQSNLTILVVPKEEGLQHQNSFLPEDSPLEQPTVSFRPPEVPKNNDKVNAYSNEKENGGDYSSLIIMPMDELKIIPNPLEFGPSDQHNIVPLALSQNPGGISNNIIQSPNLLPQNVPNSKAVIPEEHHQYQPIESRISYSEYSEYSVDPMIKTYIQQPPQTQFEQDPSFYNWNQVQNQEYYHNPEADVSPSIHEKNNFDSQENPKQSTESLVLVESEPDPTSKPLIDKKDEPTNKHRENISITNYHDNNQQVPNYNLATDANQPAYHTPQTISPQIPQQSSRGSFDPQDGQSSPDQNPSLQIIHQINKHVFVPNQVQAPILLHNNDQSQAYPRPIPSTFKPSNVYKTNSHKFDHRPFKIHRFPNGKLLIYDYTKLPEENSNIHYHNNNPQITHPKLTKYHPLLVKSLSLDQQNNGPLNIHPDIQSFSTYQNILLSQPHTTPPAPLETFLDPSKIQNEPHISSLKDFTLLPYPARPTRLPRKQIIKYNDDRILPNHQSTPIQYALLHSTTLKPSKNYLTLVTPNQLKLNGQKEPVNQLSYPFNSHLNVGLPQQNTNIYQKPTKLLPSQNQPLFGSTNKIQYYRPSRPTIVTKRPMYVLQNLIADNGHTPQEPSLLAHGIKQPNVLHKYNNYKSSPALMPGYYPDDGIANRFQQQNQETPKPKVNIHSIKPYPFGSPYIFDSTDVPTHKKLIFVPNNLGQDPESLQLGVTENPKSSVVIQYIVSNNSKNRLSLVYPKIEEKDNLDYDNIESLQVQPAVTYQYTPSTSPWPNNNKNALVTTASTHVPWTNLDHDKKQAVDKLFNEYDDLIWPLPTKLINTQNIHLEMKNSYPESNSGQNQLETPLTDPQNKDLSTSPVGAIPNQDNPALVNDVNTINPSLLLPDEDEEANITTTDSATYFVEPVSNSNVKGDLVLTNSESPDDFSINMYKTNESSSNPDDPLTVKRININETISYFSEPGTTHETVESTTEENNNTPDYLSTLFEFTQIEPNETVHTTTYSSITPDELQTIINDKADLQSRGQFDPSNETTTTSPLGDRYTSERPMDYGDGVFPSQENPPKKEESNSKEVVTVPKLKEIDSSMALGSDNFGTSLFPKMFNSRQRYKQKDQLEECGEGTQWMRNCYGCSCNFGKAVCYKIPDCVLRPFGEPMECKPYSQFKMGDCYSCICNGDGVAECDSTGCKTDAEKLSMGENPNNPEDSRAVGPVYKQYYDDKKTLELMEYYSNFKKLPKDCPDQTAYPTCEPGTSWISACHRCECKDNSRHECTRVDGCELDILTKGKPSRCKPNSKFYPKTTGMPCVECLCNDEGIPYCPTPNVD